MSLASQRQLRSNDSAVRNTFQGTPSIQRSYDPGVAASARTATLWLRRYAVAHWQHLGSPACSLHWPCLPPISLHAQHRVPKYCPVSTSTSTMSDQCRIRSSSTSPNRRSSSNDRRPSSRDQMSPPPLSVGNRQPRRRIPARLGPYRLIRPAPVQPARDKLPFLP